MTSSTKGLKGDPRSFDGFAGDYDRYAGLCDPLGDWLTGLGLTGERALDAGCGSGRHALGLAASYAEVRAVDLSAPLVEVARIRRPHPRVRYDTTDLMDFADPDGFDLVLSMSTLHHIPDLEAALTHLKGLTRPGGQVVLVDNIADRPTPPRWTYIAGATLELPREIRRHGPRNALWLHRFRTRGPWLDHLMTDRYLDGARFRAVYGRVFPGARFTDLGFAMAMRWTHP